MNNCIYNCIFLYFLHLIVVHYISGVITLKERVFFLFFWAYSVELDLLTWMPPSWAADLRTEKWTLFFVFVVAVLEATPVQKQEISCSTTLQKGCMITEIEFMCVPADPPMLCLSKSLSPQNPLHLARYTTTHWGRRIFLSPWKAVASCSCFCSDTS